MPELTVNVYTTYSDFMMQAPRILSYPIIGIDIETTGLDPHTCKIVTVQIANGEDNVVDILDTRSDNFQDFFNSLKVYTGTVCIHNAKFDLKFLYKYFGYLYPEGALFDTQIAEQVLVAGLQKSGFSLGAVSKKYLDISLDKSIREEFTLPLFTNLPLTNEQAQYGAMDAWVLPRIAKIQMERIKESSMERIIDLENEVVPIIARSELRGFKLDIDAWHKIYEDEIKLRDSLYIKLSDMAGKSFNANSHVQVKDVMKSLNVPIPEVDGKQTTREIAISTIDHPFIKTLLDYRGAAKNVSTYGDDFLDNVNPVTGRIHAEFNQMGADTGRFSSDSPNLQNIPKDERYRKCFISPKGSKIISADFTMQEIVVMAEISQDPNLLKVFREGLDRHTAAASDLFKVPYDAVTKSQRRDAKSLNFGLSYGAGAPTIANTLDISLQHANKLVEDYWKAFSVLHRCQRREGLRSWKDGYSQTLWGRKRYYPPHYDKFSIMRMGFNHLIQGTGADMTKLAVVKMDKLMRSLPGLPCIVNYVHDEVEVEVLDVYVESVANIVKTSMEEAGAEFVKTLVQKVEVAVGDYWQ